MKDPGFQGNNLYPNEISSLLGHPLRGHEPAISSIYFPGLWAMPAHQMLTGSSAFLKSLNQIRPSDFGVFRTVSRNLDGGDAAKTPLLVGSSWQLWLPGDRMLSGQVLPTLCADSIPMHACSSNQTLWFTKRKESYSLKFLCLFLCLVLEI